MLVEVHKDEHPRIAYSLVGVAGSDELHVRADIGHGEMGELTQDVQFQTDRIIGHRVHDTGSLTCAKYRY